MNWSVSIIASCLFFVSILLHELSHSLVARAYGLPVRRITLFLFGGVSNIEREPPTPKVEFLMAAVGPLTSLLLGGFLVALGVLKALYSGAGPVSADPQTAFRGFGPVSTILFWLGPINMLLGLFNLIPGFPLDGGRILRAILWKAANDLQKATAWAAGVGKVVGWLFMAAGLAMIFGLHLPVFGGGLGSGIWLILIGWFLREAAISSYRQTVIRDLLEDVPVHRLMRSDVPTVFPTLPVSSLVYDYLMRTDEQAFPVLDQGRIVGIVSLDDIRKVPRDQWELISVGQIMTRLNQLDAVSASEDAGEALEKLTRRNVRQVPVVENGHWVGLLRLQDIYRWLEIQSRSRWPNSRPLINER
ncbi:MAG TPA: site-2 protease family protein [Blastocatellia bacterium]|nr:site-2 protease family protein [Blastocatellia bacterium]